MLWAVQGASGAITERDGTRYSLTQANDLAAIAENGQLLEPCATADARGCIDRSRSRPRIRLSGQTLELPGHRLTIEGPVSRRVDVELIQGPEGAAP